MLQLNNVKSGYSTGIINSNFQAVEEYINNYVLNRDGVAPGEANQMNVHLDMNSKNILNVGRMDAKEIGLNGMPIKELLDNTVEEATQEANRAEQEADRAKQEADRAERAAEDLDGPFSFLGDYGPGLVATSYNQVVRDSNGEFWRVSGQVDLPYTTTGTGLPEGGAFVPAGDAVLRQDLANPDQGAAMVAYNHGRDYPAGSVGRALSVRTITGGSIFSALTSEGDNGLYRVSGITDGPGFNGIARVVLDDVGGSLYGYCEMTSYGGYPPLRSVAACTAGVWGGWRPIAWGDQISMAGLVAAGDSINASGAIVSTDQIIPICRGSYSWWNEPQSIALGTLSQKMVVGAVSTSAPGAHKLVQVKASGNTNQTEISYLPDAARYVPDEHNGPVTIEAGDGIVSFFPGHNDRDYLPYWVGSAPDISSLGTVEKRIEPGVGNVSYAQAWYTDHVATQNPRVWCAFRADSNRTWYIAWSEDWDAPEPIWTTHPFVTDTDQMYVRMVWRPDRSTPVVRFLATKNASYDTTNGIWFGYVDMRTGDIKTGGGVTVGALGSTPVQMESDLTKIYSAPRRIRLYDAMGDATSVPMLLSTFSGGSGGPYKYVRYDISTWSITHDVDIVASGPDMATGSYYFGGAHFSNVTEGGLSAVGPGPVYVARSSGGTWLLEEYVTSDGGNSWSLARVIDSSTTEKIWRPRVPYNTRQRYQPRQVVLTYCKGQWASYTDYDSTVYAVLRSPKSLG